jgi:uncharacterized protein (UPF0335 family)
MRAIIVLVVAFVAIAAMYNDPFRPLATAQLPAVIAQAERHAVEGRRLIARQEALIASLHRRGHDAANTRKVLDALKDTQAIHEDDVRRLRDELDAASQPSSF